MVNFNFAATQVVDMMEMCNLLLDNGYRLVKVAEAPIEDPDWDEEDAITRKVDEQNRKWREIMADEEDSVMARELAMARRRAELAQIEAEVDNPKLIGALKRWRAQKAKELNMSAYIVLSNKTLLLIAYHAPATMDELLSIHGFGSVKAERYGAEILDLIAKESEEIKDDKDLEVVEL